MSDLMSVSELVEMLEAGRGLAAAAAKSLHACPDEYFRLGGGPASALLPTYVAGLEHVTRQQIPYEGLEEFVTLLKRLQDTRVLAHRSRPRGSSDTYGALVRGPQHPVGVHDSCTLMIGPDDAMRLPQKQGRASGQPI